MVGLVGWSWLVGGSVITWRTVLEDSVTNFSDFPG